MRNRREFLITTGMAGAIAGSLLADAAPVQAAEAPPAKTTFVLSPDADPLQLFAQWFEDAKAIKEPEASAMTLATVDATGLPDARMMLHKEIRGGRFLFLTHVDSTKGAELKENPKAALVFYWRTLKRQVRVRGLVEQLSTADADAAWVTRGPRVMKLNDWAWNQSQVVKNVEELERRRAEVEQQFGENVPRPQGWSGYLLAPLSIEFFISQPTFVHERLRFYRSVTSDTWKAQRLVP